MMLGKVEVDVWQLWAAVAVGVGLALPFAVGSIRARRAAVKQLEDVQETVNRMIIWFPDFGPDQLDGMDSSLPSWLRRLRHDVKDLANETRDASALAGQAVATANQAVALATEAKAMAAEASIEVKGLHARFDDRRRPDVG